MHSRCCSHLHDIWQHHASQQTRVQHQLHSSSVQGLQDIPAGDAAGAATGAPLVDCGASLVLVTPAALAAAAEAAAL